MSDARACASVNTIVATDRLHDSEAVLAVWLPAPLPRRERRLIGARFGRWREE